MPLILCKKCGAKVSNEFSLCTNCHAALLTEPETVPPLSDEEPAKPQTEKAPHHSLVSWLSTPLETSSSKKTQKELSVSKEKSKTTHRILRILDSFECPVERIELEPRTLTIRAATGYELSIWGNESYTHVIEYIDQENKADSRILDLGVLALFLFKPGEIRVRGSVMGGLVQVNSRKSTPAGSLYTLTETEILQFVSFYKALRSIVMPPQVLVAVRRLTTSMEELNLEGKLLDSMTAIESLISTSKDAERNEVIQDRISSLLAGTPEGTNRIKDELDFGFQLRNEVVDNGEFSTEMLKKLRRELGLSVEELCVSLNLMLRESLRIWLEFIKRGQCTSKPDLIEKLKSGSINNDLQTRY